MLHIYFYIYIYHLYNIDYHLKVQCTDSRLFFFNVRSYIFYICRSAYLVFAPFRFLVLSSCTPIYVSLFSSKNVVEVKRLQSLVSFLCTINFTLTFTFCGLNVTNSNLLKPKCEKKLDEFKSIICPNLHSFSSGHIKGILIATYLKLKTPRKSKEILNFSFIITIMHLFIHFAFKTRFRLYSKQN